MFTGKFERPSDLILDSYITPTDRRDVYGPWSGLWELFPLTRDVAISDEVEDALNYRDSRLLPFLRTGAARLSLIAPIVNAEFAGTEGNSWEPVYPALEEPEFIDPAWFMHPQEDPGSEPFRLDIGCRSDPAA